MIWTRMHPRARPEMLGYLPGFLSEDDPRPAREQFNSNYQSGWRPTQVQLKMAANGDLLYPGDPPVKPIYETRLRDEVIRLYDFSWVAVIQPDGSFEICRMD